MNAYIFTLLFFKNILNYSWMATGGSEWSYLMMKQKKLKTWEKREEESNFLSLIAAKMKVGTAINFG